jgi:putative nucleotidyltransferase with HDIG domain
METLAGVRLLLAGGEAGAADPLRGWLALAGASAGVCGPDPRDAVAAVAADAPHAVIVVGERLDDVRRALDPLGLDAGPAVLPLADVLAPGEALGPPVGRRLRAFIDRRALREGQLELERVVAAEAVGRRRDVDAAQLDALRRLGLLAEYRDDNTADHMERVGELAAQVARHLGLDSRTVSLVRRAAPLHDVGKIAIPDTILLKPGRLTDEEYEVVKTHAVLGARVLAGAEADVLQVAERIARSHHERWDGQGYPDGLAGEDIPVEARLVHVADVFDVLMHERPYKDSWTQEAAAEEIRRGAGTQFDPAVVEAFEALGAAAWRAVSASAP